MARRIFLFGQSARDGSEIGDHSETSPQVLGGKGAGLAIMSGLRLPVPPGFTISTAASADYASSRQLAPALQTEILQHLAFIEDAAGARFGDAVNPLLVSVRSGAPRSMPGMLDTVLNIGLNEATVAGLVRRTGNARFAWDSYRRFILSYADLVVGLDTQPFEDRVRAAPEVHGVPDWQKVTAEYLRLFEREAGMAFPQDAQEQLWTAIAAVLESWESRRARAYRALHGVPDQPGIAISIQAMVFGNAGESSGTGVGFSRNPTTGAPEAFGEYLPDAQGGDVVSGVSTPHPIAGDEPGSLRRAMPAVFDALLASFRTLEQHFGTVQDVEFTVERGKLWLLQTRPAVLSAAASVRVAVDMAAEQLISREDAIRRADARQLTGLLHPTIAANAPRTLLAKGLPASPGAATGPVTFSADEAESRAKHGERPVLVLSDTQPRDLLGLHAAHAVLTSRGGATSHAAVIARGLGRPCVVGASELRVDAAGRRFVARGREVRAGDVVTIDGTSGEVFLGSLPLQQPEVGPHLATLLGWADAVPGRLEVRVNTETAADVARGRSLGAQGVGLFRTEYTFLAEPALAHMRALILSDGAGARLAALQAMLALQRGAYTEVLRLADGMPLALRLLDLPLSSFLPESDDDIVEAARALRTTPAEIRARGQSLAESNPVFGHRGCRLAVSWPDLYAMQVRGLFEAAQDAGTDAKVQILVPLVSMAAEFNRVVADIARVADEVRRERGSAPSYQIGAIIELPRAALQAGELARCAEVLSLGTNNLTQATLGFARDDAAAFLNRYRERGLLAADPFVSIDTEGVGELVRTAITRARATRPGIEIGVCGEQAGDPASIEFFRRAGVDYVSVSPYRLPIARLATAQAALKG